jgi:hypothetical protein
MTSEQKIIRNKVGLLKLAQTLGAESLVYPSTSVLKSIRIV